MKTKAVLVMFLLLSLCIGVGGSVIRGGRRAAAKVIRPFPL